MKSKGELYNINGGRILTIEWNALLSDERLGGKMNLSFTETKFERSEFERDYSRIVSNASFRRLQDKTQVFPLDSSDFVRTRLTHSLEVASVAKELGKAVEQYLVGEKFIKPKLAVYILSWNIQ